MQLEMSSKVTVCATVLAVAAVSVFLMWKRRRSSINIGKIKKLIIYPIKSLPGIEVPSLEVLNFGVQYKNWIDRGYLLLDPKTNFVITLRQKTSLTLLKLSFHGDNELWIESPDQKILKIKNEQQLNADCKIRENSIWGGPSVKCADCGDEAAAWFQEYLQHQNCRLVKYFREFPLRPSYEVNGPVEERNSDELIALQDANAVHLINDTSIEEFKSKLSTETVFSYRNFRPNIVVESKAYSEDYWRELQINNVSLRRQKKTGRCTVPNVNTDTSVRMSQVAEALKKHRSPKGDEEIAAYGKTPLFGINCCVKETGIITTDDEVIVTIY